MGKWLKSTEQLRFEVRDHVAWITLNRPEKRNALNWQSLQELRDALLEADDLTSVHCIVLGGAGRDFCAGWDLTGGQPSPVKEQQDAAHGVTGEYRSQTATIDDDMWQLGRMNELRLVLFDMHKPVIAKVQGNCIANGTDIALLADLVIVASDARIGYPPVRAQGSPPSHMWLYHMGPQWAKRMLLTGDLLRGRDAARLGLALESVAPAKLDAHVEALAARIAATAPDLLACNKRVVNLGLELMGAKTLQRLASEIDARGHLSEGRMQFRRSIEALGLKEAVRQRDAAFGDGMVDYSQE
ncbi:crotonase/enoyl-CoA hydratase family protein [Sphingomonas sp. TDK1]|uniref:crotonase/enoyl-CoA hydratase family protein n=1 Tax=Sphingomonas sp. TDK1 TaxID=453247 RepID=UPI0007D8E6BB|nr:crotonase/enoyl-CoA hydratase family protein [Sphingomonas sp. TDK1]OAN65889.1 enoyl-CoA hydratase [Sphingomonas sp. TDK1]